MDHFDPFDQQELKLIYGILQAQLMEETALMDAAFLTDLQSHLHQRAEADGVDVGDHAAWMAWLTSKPSGGLKLV